MISLLSTLFLLISEPLPAFDRALWTAFPNMNSVTSLAEGSQYIYVGTLSGIRRYDIYGERWHRPLTVLDGLPDNRIRALAYDSHSGELWMDTPSGAARWLTRLETVSFSATTLHRVVLQRRYHPSICPLDTSCRTAGSGVREGHIQ